MLKIPWLPSASIRRGRQRLFSGITLSLGHLILAALLGMFYGCTGSRCVPTGAFGNLGPSVNSQYDDYAPALQDTATLIFTSNRPDEGEGGLQEMFREIRPTHLFFSMRLSDKWDDGQPYKLTIDAEGESATIAFAPPNDPFNTVAYISACDRPSGIGGCDIYAVTSSENSPIVNLGPGINSPGWDGHPFVTPDGRRLYFASDRDGGYGGTDIWISDRLPSGAWETPHNAGPTVNTSGDENAPFFDASTGRLYFAASTPTYGLDIFVLDSEATERRQLPAPYSSEADDTTPFLIDGMLYLASKRTGGCGGFDLYAFPIR